MPMSYRRALIVGAGSGLDASLARRLASEGLKVALAARSGEKSAKVAAETGAASFGVDASDAGQVAALFETLDKSFGAPDVVIYNASYRTRGPLVDLDPAEVQKSLAVTVFGGFLVAQQAARRMLASGQGAMFFTGASASVKGYAQSGAVRHGQGGAARARAIDGARTLAARHPCGALRDRRRHRERTPPAIRRQAGRAARSGRDRRDLRQCVEAAAQAPGVLRSKCGRGWRTSSASF